MSNYLPQIIYLVLTFMGLGITLVEHGKEKTGKHNFWTTLVSTAIIFFVLYWGGFFSARG